MHATIHSDAVPFTSFGKLCHFPCLSLLPPLSLLSCLMAWIKGKARCTTQLKLSQAKSPKMFKDQGEILA